MKNIQHGSYPSDNFYFDIHGHTGGTIPVLWKIASMFRMPKDRRLRSLAEAGIGGVVCAIGDPGTFKRGSGDSMSLTRIQIERIRKRIQGAGLQPVLTYSGLNTAHENKSAAFIIGIEGGDFLEGEISRLRQVWDDGARLLVPVHYSSNCCGSIAMGWRGRVIPDEEHTGLTDFGRQVITESNRLGMIIDLAHADERTLLESAAESKAPVICSHTGPLGIQGFARYISDKAIKEIADSGGIIGLWPYYMHGAGMEGPEIFKMAASYIRNLAGADAVAIGTDFNGVPGYMNGFADVSESARLPALLSEAGFSDEEIGKAAGLNFLRVFSDVESAAGTAGKYGDSSAG